MSSSSVLWKEHADSELQPSSLIFREYNVNGKLVFMFYMDRDIRMYRNTIEHNALYTVLQAMQKELSNPINTVAILAGRLCY